jgi:hypothetical protein
VAASVVAWAAFCTDASFGDSSRGPRIESGSVLDGVDELSGETFGSIDLDWKLIKMSDASGACL